ncbi:P-loop containing nucleoside triphosphate hydrolase protein [Mycena pura]|uniref:DNA 3'-5' helicase n=1 Tax=Mycena pura TaxID=153505 RepID=A0AAD6V7F2_9AGAR|nr:P-loop containing nucleoside triphosphate hydrolase protein [Mycena pura]
MPDLVSWHSVEGAATVKAIVKARIPSWKDGLRLQQEEPILRILDGQDVLLCTATGAGKSALFTVPIICHQELAKYPSRYPNFRRRALPVGLVITPTKGLARSIVDSLATHDVSALAYDRETLVRAAHEHRNLIEDIASCTLFRVICVDPEHLHSTPWQRILDTAVFRENLIYACLEEGHLANEWLTFRESYRNIGTFLRGRLPSHTSDLQFVLETLKHGISGRSFPQLLPYLNTGRKAVIYASSLDIVTRIYTYLFRMEPPGVDHGRRVRQYTALCDPSFNAETLRLMETDPQLQIVVATVALANGIHCSSIDDSLSIGMPSTLSQMEQQAGRAARLPGAIGRAVVFVQKSDVTRAKNYLAGAFFASVFYSYTQVLQELLQDRDRVQQLPHL